MTSEPVKLSAFEQGNQAGRTRTDIAVANPFAKGSAEHNNFEVGRRFGASHTKPSARALIADVDEEEN